jgi:hypothetical protein
MMTGNEFDRLATLYRALQDQIPDIGFIALGSVIERYTVCGAPTCRCQAEPPVKHGPYFQYSRKLHGKTLTRRLTAEQAERYRGWISNRRALDHVIDQMDQLSRQIADLMDNSSNRAKSIER